MKPKRLIALTAAAGLVAAGAAGCSSHKTAPGASTTPAKTSVPPGVWQTQDLTALSGAPAAEPPTRQPGPARKPDRDGSARARSAKADAGFAVRMRSSF